MHLLGSIKHVVGLDMELKRNSGPLPRDQREGRSTPAHALSRAAMVYHWFTTFMVPCAPSANQTHHRGVPIDAGVAARAAGSSVNIGSML